MKLNKNDLHAFKKFLVQMEQGFNDEMVDKYAPTLKRFIEERYESKEDTLSGLEDFIAEALIIIYNHREAEQSGSYNKGFFIMNLQRKYDSFIKSETNKYVRRIEENEDSFEIDEKKLFFKQFLANERLGLSEREQIAVEDFLEKAPLTETAEKINTSSEYARVVRLQAIEKIKGSEEFREYFSDEVAKLLEYEHFLEFYIKGLGNTQLIGVVASISDLTNQKERKNLSQELIEFFEFLEQNCTEQESEKYRRMILSDKNEIKRKYTPQK